MSKRAYRVLLVNLTKAFGGADVRVLSQARALQGVVPDCTVATLYGSALHERLVHEGLPHIPVKVGRGNPRMIFSLRQLMRSGHYDIVDAHNVQSILWAHYAAVLARAGGRVTTIHSDFGKEYPGFKGRLYEAVLTVTRPLTKEYVMVTKELHQAKGTGSMASRSTYIPNAIAIPPQPQPGKDGTKAAEWGFSADDFIITIIGRLKPVKGHSYLFDALAQLKDLPQVKVLVVGTGPLEQDLRNQIETLNLAERVHFAGFRKDVEDMLTGVDLLCIPSLSEALPYVLLEAASRARPVLATKVGGLVNLLADGETARLVPSQDAQSLAEAIRWLVANPDETTQLGLNVYDMVRQSFSVEAMIDATLNVYDRALNE